MTKLKNKNKNKSKNNIQGDSCYQEVPGLAEAAHSALDASIYRFSNDGPHFKDEIVDPQKSSLVGCFVET